MLQKKITQYPPPATIDKQQTNYSLVLFITTAFALLFFSTVSFLFSHTPTTDSQQERQENSLSLQYGEHEPTHHNVATDVGQGLFFKSTYDLDGLTEKSRNDYCIDLYDGDTRIATIYVAGYRGSKSDEAKQVCFLLGKAYCNGIAKDVYLNLFFIDENGKCLHWNEAGGELAVCALFNTTDEEFASSFSLVQNPTGTAWKHCAPILIGEDRSPTPEINHSSEDTREFWGVWIGATKDKTTADSIVDSAKDEGFDDAQVIVTSDWENLNPETWYAITVGCFDSEKEAEANLEKARCINQDAYIKHSGSHT